MRGAKGNRERPPTRRSVDGGQRPAVGEGARVAAVGSLDLGTALRLDGIDEEVAMLRTLVHREYHRGAGGDSAELRRLILALCGAMRLQRSLAGHGREGGRELINEILDDLGTELENGAV